jgi:SAM-dependent methyltransferase
MRAPTPPRRLVHAWIVALALAGGCAWSAPAVEMPASPLDVAWVPSAPEVIRAMLETAKVGPGDVVYDLGCGNGEIVIAAAKLYGARAVGVDLDPGRIREARHNAARAEVTDRVTFVEQDLFVTDVTPATVVTLYLLPDLNARLRPKLLRELRPGARIVSHDFGIADWAPERTVEVPLSRTHRVFLWRIPGG